MAFNAAIKRLAYDRHFQNPVIRDRWYWVCALAVLGMCIADTSLLGQVLDNRRSHDNTLFTTW